MQIQFVSLEELINHSQLFFSHSTAIRSISLRLETSIITYYKKFLKARYTCCVFGTNTVFRAMTYVAIFPYILSSEFQIVGQGIVRMQTDERIARVALQWLPLSPGRGSGMQIAATGFRLQCLRVVRKGRYVTHRADRAYTRCVYIATILSRF